MLPLSLAWFACNLAAPPAEVAPVERTEVDRDQVNRRAVYHDVPAFWIEDRNNDHIPGSDEVAWVWTGKPYAPLYPNGRPSTRLTTLLRPLAAPIDTREKALQTELDAGRPTLVLTEVAESETPFVDAMLAVATAIEKLHALQRGATMPPADDPRSRAVFRRNQGPWCVSNRDPACTATTPATPRIVGIYPAPLQSAATFCTTLEKRPELMTPFTAVRRVGGELVGVPYHQAWPEASRTASLALTAAADQLPDNEAPLAAYLRRAAASFLDGDWVAADRAWLKTRNASAWYVRVGPDETYWDPCDRKAGYHLSFARLNPASLAWQQKLEPHKAAMETHLAAKSGPYSPRDVQFSLPEFIDVVVNAGDARSPLGATVGQSLPNWGPVAEAGGRTVAMTNLNTDRDSLAFQTARAAALFCSVDGYTSDPEPLLFSTLLHEAAHNLGPAAGYTVNGQTDEQAFGGELATMLEELKAQTAALTLTDWLAEREVVTTEFAHQAHMADLLWAMGKVSLGMNGADGALAYPRLSAIQLGLLQQAGVVTWKPDVPAANGDDLGCFDVDTARLPAAFDAMADTVFGIKGRADVPAARALVRDHVDGADAALHDLITERWNRSPQNSMVYGFRFSGR